MAFYSIVDPTNEEIELPWFNEFLETTADVSDGDLHEVLFVKSTDKGYIVTTLSFNAWVWRKTPLGQNMSEQLAQALKSDIHPTMCVMVSTKVKTKFQIGFIDDVYSKFTWSGENRTYTLHSQKNLPLDLPLEIEHESKGGNPTGKPQRQSSAPRKASVTTSRVESSQ